MIVDPATGLPIEYSATQEAMNAQSLTGQLGINAAQGAGYKGQALNVLANLPSATVLMGWNTGRGANTILRGGFADRELGRMQNHLRPAAWRRLSHVGNLDSTGIYSPMDFLSRSGDWTARKLMAGGWGFKGAKATAARDYMTAEGLVPQAKGQYFSSGVLSRMGAASRISRGKFDHDIVRTSLMSLDPEMAKAIPRGISQMSSGAMTHAVLGSTRGSVSQVAAGYMGGALAGPVPEWQAKSMLAGPAKATYLKYAGKATEHLAAGGARIGTSGVLEVGSKELAARTGKAIGQKVGVMGLRHVAAEGGLKTAGALGLRAAGLAIPGVNVLMTAWMVYDLTKMAIAAAPKVGAFAKDAIISAKGSIDKPVMGMGYKDTAVAATSRSRGVMAISNSRLNARSVLGSEASQMFAHFG